MTAPSGGGGGVCKVRVPYSGTYVLQAVHIQITTDFTKFSEQFIVWFLKECKKE